MLPPPTQQALSPNSCPAFAPADRLGKVQLRFTADPACPPYSVRHPLYGEGARFPRARWGQAAPPIGSANDAFASGAPQCSSSEARVHDSGTLVDIRCSPLEILAAGYEDGRVVRPRAEAVGPDRTHCQSPWFLPNAYLQPRSPDHQES